MTGDANVIPFHRRRRRSARDDAELYAAIATANPDLITTVAGLMAELADADLPPDLLHGLGVRVRRLGDALTARALRAAESGP